MKKTQLTFDLPIFSLPLTFVQLRTVSICQVCCHFRNDTELKMGAFHSVSSKSQIGGIGYGLSHCLENNWASESSSDGCSSNSLRSHPLAR